MTSSINSVPGFEERLKLISKLEQPGKVEFALNEKFVDKLPTPSASMLDYHEDRVNRFRVYINLTQDVDTVLACIKRMVSHGESAVDSSLFMINIANSFPEFPPLFLAQSFLLEAPKDPQAWRLDKYWEALKYFDDNFNLTDDDILEGITYKELLRIDLGSAQKLGITAEKIESTRIAFQSDTTNKETPKNRCIIV